MKCNTCDCEWKAGKIVTLPSLKEPCLSCEWHTVSPEELPSEIEVIDSKIRCPLCKEIYIEGLESTPFCKCGKAAYYSLLGWYVSFEFLKHLSSRFHLEEPDNRKKVMDFLSRTIPDLVINVEAGLDGSVVKLFCSNSKCVEKGYITRTRENAKKNVYACAVCGSPLKIQS